MLLNCVRKDFLSKEEIHKISGAFKPIYLYNLKLQFQMQYFKDLLVTLILYRKQLHLSSLSQILALGICSAPGLYHKFLEGIHNSPNDVLLLSPKVKHIQQNSTHWAAILQCIITDVISHPGFKCFHFSPSITPPKKPHQTHTHTKNQTTHKTKQTQTLDPSLELRRLVLIFKQFFI